MSAGHHGTIWLAGLAAVLLANACRSSAPRNSAVTAAEPSVIDVGAGSPEAIATRSAVALVDAPRLADTCSRWDARFLVRFEESQRADIGTLGRFRELVRSALLGTGRFLVTEEDAAPVIVVGIRGPLGNEHSDVLVRGPDGEIWVRVCGSVVGPE